jgi:hypothetical protein
MNSKKALREHLNYFERPKEALGGLSKEELEAKLDGLITGGAKLKCIAGCKPKSSCDCFEISIEGAGFFDFFKAPKKAYNNTSKNTLKKFGAAPIVHIEIVRTPIVAMLDKVINFISLGKFKVMKDKVGYDKLFHLAMVVKVAAGNGMNKPIVVEKNEVVNVSAGFNVKNTTQTINVNLNGKALTLNEMLENTRRTIGDGPFFLYDALKNNCQDFILNILKVNGLADNENVAFVKQDVETIAKGLPEHVKKFMNFTTNLGARVNQAIGGAAGDRAMTYAEWVANNERLKKETSVAANAVNETNGYNQLRREQRVAEARNAREMREQWDFFEEYGFDPDVDKYAEWKSEFERKNKVFLKRDKNGNLMWQPIEENAWDRINEVVPMGEIMTTAADIANFIPGINIPDPTPFVRAAYNGFDGSGKHMGMNPRLRMKFNEFT